ncbi:hypothetical protein U3516DRAFT_871560 [Neocallimastix sp. 'constans']
MEEYIWRIIYIIYYIKANNNNVIGEIVSCGNGCAITTKIVTFNGRNNVIHHYIVGRIVIIREREFLLDVENNIIDEFYSSNENRNLYLSDIRSLLTQYLMTNVYAPVSLEKINNDNILYLRDMYNFITQ